MKKILFVLPTFPSYRIDFFNRLKKKLKYNNYDLIVLAGENKSNKQIFFIKSLPKYVKIFKTKSFKFFGFSINYQKKLISEVKKIDPDQIVLLFNIGNINFLILFLYYKFLNKKIILWVSGYQRIDLTSFQLKIKNIISNFFLLRANKIITYGSSYRDYIIKKGFKRKNIIASFNTINTEKNLIKSNYNLINKDKRVFLYVGAINKFKNLDVLIKSLKYLKNKDKFYLNIVGKGNYLDTLIMLSKKEGVNKYISFHGVKFGNELSKLFKESNIFILPGIGGLAVNEAMSFGLPIISTRGDGTLNDFVDNSNGLLIDYNLNPILLSEIIETFILKSNHDLEKMSKKSIEKIKKIGSLKYMVSNFEKIIYL